VSRFRLHLLGTLAVEETGDRSIVELPPGKPLAVLAYLALEGGPVYRDELAELLWPQTDRTHSKASVRQALFTLRKELKTEDLFPSDDPVELREGCIETDLESFREALRKDDLDTANSLWHGPPLNGLCFPGAREWDRWVDSVRTVEEGRYGGALAKAAEAAAFRGDILTAKELWGRAIEVQPYRLSHHASLIENLLASHNLQEAEDAIHSARKSLDDPQSNEALEELSSRLLLLRRQSLREQEPQQLRTEFVGRIPEFSALSNLWKAAKGGLRRAGLILGPPGIGKTRLGEELALLVSSEGGRAVRVKATEAEQSLEWGVFGDLVRLLYGLPGAAGISEGSSVVLARLLPSLDRGKTKQARELSGLSSEPTAIADALRDLVAAVAEEEPLLVLVDDLQWADGMSQVALSRTVRSLSRSPVLFLLLSRVKEDETRPAGAFEGIGQTDWAHVKVLGPLAKTEVAELLTLMLAPTDPGQLEGFSQQLRGITQGNPLFIVEMLKLLEEEGFLAPSEDGRWVLAPEATTRSLPVPETIEAAIERRLEDISPNAKVLAVHLARLERPQARERLRQKTGLEEVDLAEGVRELLGRDLIRLDSQGSMEFVHDTVREVAARIFSHLHKVPQRWGMARLLHHRTALWGFGIGVLTTAVAATWILLPLTRQESVADEFGLPDARLLVTAIENDGERRVLEVDLEDSDRPFRPADEPAEGLTSPDGSVRVLSVGTPTGLHLQVLDMESGVAHTITDRDGDQLAEAFSPDSRRLLFTEGEPFDAGTRYRHRLGILELGSWKHQLLRLEKTVRPGTGAWSPDGTRVAFLSDAQGSPEVCVTDLGGTQPWCFTDEEARGFSPPSWSFDGNRIAVVAEGSGESHLILLPSKGGSPVTVGAALHPIGSTVWLSESVLACVSGSPGEGDLWLIDTSGLEPIARRLTEVGNLVGVEGVIRDHTAANWIETVDIWPAVSAVSPGQYLPLSLIPERADGTRLADLSDLPIHWEASDPGLATVSDSGLVRVLEAGTIGIVANLGGWRADTLTVTSEPAVELERPLIFEETWVTGLKPGTWTTYGSPTPRVREEGGPEGSGVFFNNGNQSYTSGALSVDRFSPVDGLTVEAWGYLPSEGGLWQDFYLGLSASPHLDENGERRPAARGVGLLVETNPSATTVFWADTIVADLPLPDLDRWVLYGIQLAPNGVVSIVIDGKLFWRSGPETMAFPTGTELLLDLGGRSVGAEVKHGPVRLFSGEKYRVDPNR
jgi:DNA-binding SARP family transcriptional activator